MYQSRLNGSSATEMQKAYFSGGILLRYLLQKFYDFELNSILWRKATRCPICLETLLVKDTYNSQCGHSLHKYCFEKWRNIDENCQVCRKKAIFETIDNDLLGILSYQNPPRNENDADEEDERESNRLVRENVCSHLKIMHAVMLLDAALKL
ncbi:unnamed protein product [Litomosoides sigmodontis]|uniref:RING-type domain-containing protein n=1 Tax=Litomosoides sigmodontis TaxID=42156 RepID=A0A3P6U1V7_LITSI|nr:unnamed protein product [Litomosoides sigmodontis]